MGELYLIEEEILADIADSIREKTGDLDVINPIDMATQIDGIFTGYDIFSYTTQQGTSFTIPNLFGVNSSGDITYFGTAIATYDKSIKNYENNTCWTYNTTNGFYQADAAVATLTDNGDNFTLLMNQSVYGSRTYFMKG